VPVDESRSDRFRLIAELGQHRLDNGFYCKAVTRLSQTASSSAVIWALHQKPAPPRASLAAISHGGKPFRHNG
jgi:hypothetical protein